MFVVISISIIAFILTLLNSKGILESGMKMGFILVTILGCIHYNYGNDYMAYYGIYQMVEEMPFEFSTIVDNSIFHEPGWVFLNYLFKPIGGFFVLVAVLNILQNYIVYKFIKDNVEKDWWWMGIFTYLFCTSFYVLNFSMMRQGLAIALFLAIWPWIRDRKIIPAAIAVAAISTIHTSAILLFPFIFWGFLPARSGKLWIVGYAAIFAALWMSEDLINSFIERLTMVGEFDEYIDAYSEENNFALSLGFLLNLTPLIMALYYLAISDNESENNKIVSLAAMGFIAIPFSRIIPTAGRFGLFFTIFQMAAIPVMAKEIKSDIVRIGALAIIIMMTSIDYFRFFGSDVWSEAYSEFHTIFECI